MEENEEEFYDDTVPNEAYIEPVTKSRSQAKGNAEGTRDDQPHGDPQTAGQINTGARQKTNALKRQSQDKGKTKEALMSQDSIEMPSTPGVYYFDGEKFTEHRPAETGVYVPGSDYCHVTNPKNSDGSGYESDTSTSMSSEEEVKVHSSLSSGLQTLNINISLNVADLVKNTLSGRRRRKKTRKKKGNRNFSSQIDVYEMEIKPFEMPPCLLDLMHTKTTTKQESANNYRQRFHV